MFMERIQRDLSTGYFDKDMLSLVEEINKHPEMYTTSSCSGRIVLLKASKPWNKNNVTILGKWHEKVSLEEVTKNIKPCNKDSGLWLILQSPIIHVSCKNIETAIKLVRKARSCGFRYSSTFSKGNAGIFVEIMGSERIDLPLIIEDKVIINPESLNKLLEYLNTMLKNIKTKIQRLSEAVKTL
mgnify:FL=1